jgi:hypothetical protein
MKAIKEHDVVVLTLGDDPAFRASQLFVRWLSASYGVSANNADVELLKAYDEEQVGNVLLRRVGLLHVMGHGDPKGHLYGQRNNGPLLSFRAERRFKLRAMQRWVSRHQIYPRLDCVLLDACDTFSETWLTGLSEILEPGRGPHSSMVVIGTTRKVGWDEASTYTGAFYSALLRHPFPPPEHPGRRRRACLVAHDRASAAYRSIMGAASPFRATVLTAE